MCVLNESKIGRLEDELRLARRFWPTTMAKRVLSRATKYEGPLVVWDKTQHQPMGIPLDQQKFDVEPIKVLPGLKVNAVRKQDTTDAPTLEELLVVPIPGMPGPRRGPVIPRRSRWPVLSSPGQVEVPA
jgi:hypothetical protein